MKKSLIILFVLSLVFSACEGPEGPQGIPGRDGILYQDVHEFKVNKGDWILGTDADGLNPHYYYEFDFPELTRKIYQEGSIHGYLYVNPNNLGLGYTPLTESYPLEDDYGYNWTEHYSYICYPGGITFTARFSDFEELEDDPNYYLRTQAFRIVLEWK